MVEPSATKVRLSEPLSKSSEYQSHETWYSCPAVRLEVSQWTSVSPDPM